MLTHSYDEPVCKPIVGGPTILDGLHYFYMQHFVTSETMLNYNRVQYKVFSMIRWRTVLFCVGPGVALGPKNLATNHLFDLRIHQVCLSAANSICYDCRLLSTTLKGCGSQQYSALDNDWHKNKFGNCWLKG